VTDARRDTGAARESRSLYRLLAQSVQDPDPGERQPPPTTVLTATIETIDNDRAVALMPGLPLP
jgi:hypothetical protein